MRFPPGTENDAFRTDPASHSSLAGTDNAKEAVSSWGHSNPAVLVQKYTRVSGSCNTGAFGSEPPEDCVSP